MKWFLFPRRHCYQNEKMFNTRGPKAVKHSVKRNSHNGVDRSYIEVMSVTNVEPEKLRPELHERIEQMPPAQLVLLHRIVLKLDLERAAEDLHVAFDAARKEGKFDRADEIIRDVRARHPYA